jgi:hypothetical protein
MLCCAPPELRRGVSDSPNPGIVFERAESKDSVWLLHLPD